jgi:hypothetical protein
MAPSGACYDRGRHGWSVERLDAGRFIGIIANRARADRESPLDFRRPFDRKAARWRSATPRTMTRELNVSGGVNNPGRSHVLDPEARDGNEETIGLMRFRGSPVGWVVAFAFVALACRSQGGSSGLMTISLTQAELQARVAPKFPVTIAKPLVTVTLENPKVLLPEGRDRIGLAVDIRVKLPLGKSVSGKAAALGVPRYDGASRAFYFADPTIETFEVEGMNPEHEQLVRSLVQAAAATTLERVPIYHLDHNYKQIAAAAILKETAVRNSALHLSLGLP